MPVFSAFPTFWRFGWGIYDCEYVILNACEATCTEDGYWGSYSTCNREGCDYSTKSDRYVDKALGHLLKHYDAKPADCLPGWDEYDECQRKGCDYTTKVEIPANGKHSYVCDVCTTCDGLNPVRYTREGDYIYFGYWPQTCERDETVIAKLNEMAGTPPLPRDNANLIIGKVTRVLLICGKKSLYITARNTSAFK